MRSSRLCSAAALVLVLLPTPALAAAPGDGAAAVSPTPPGPRLTLSGAVKLALRRGPDSRAADLAVESARGALLQASLLPNPSFTVATNGVEISPAAAPIPNQVSLEWPIPIGGKRGAGIDAARAGLDAAQASRRATRRQAVLAVESAFVTVLLDRAQLAFERKSRAQFRQSLALNELRYKDGKIAFGEVLKLRIEALAEDDAVREAKEALVGARADLRALIGGIAPGFVVDGALAAPAIAAPADASALLSAALAHRSDFLALKDQEKQAAALLDQAQRQPIPDLDVALDYNTEPKGAGNYDILLSVPLPIFDRNQGNVTQAEAAYAQAKLATERLRLQIQKNARRAVAEWQTSQAQLAAYTGHLLSAAKQSLDISRRAYDLGSGSLLDYLDAESSYREVEIAYRAALARTMLAAATLRFIAGEDTP